MRRISILFFLVSAIVGCGNGFDPANYVSSLRLIDVKAEPAEVPGGGVTNMTATWANPGQPTPTIRWDYCTLAANPSMGAINPNCVNPDMAGSFLVPIGTGDSVSLTMPVIPLTQLGLPDGSDGFYLPIRLRLDDGKQDVTAIFMLRYYLGSISPNPPNKNPTLMGVYRVPSADAGADEQTTVAENMPIDVHNGDQIDLRALLTADSAEQYMILSSTTTNGKPTTMTVTETVSITWLATAGEFTNEVTGEAKPDTTWKLDKDLPASGTTVDMWLVARDERGGSDVTHRTFNFK